MTHSKQFEIVTTLAVAAAGMAISGYLWLYTCGNAHVESWHLNQTLGLVLRVGGWIEAVDP